MPDRREKLIQRWIETAENDFKVMQNLFDLGHYVWALFIGHLVIEKLIKVYFMKVQHKDAPRIHDLERLAELAQIEITADQARELTTLTAFNIRARYPNYKYDVNKLANKSYAAKQIEVVKKWREQLLQQLSKEFDPS